MQRGNMNYNDYSGGGSNIRKSEYQSRLPSLLENEMKLLQGGGNAHNQSGMMHINEDDQLLASEGGGGVPSRIYQNQQHF